METGSYIAIGLAIVSLIGVFSLGFYIYDNQPVEADLSGIYENQNDIDDLFSDMGKMQKDIDDLDLVCEVTEDDLEDLEDDLERYCRNRCEDGEDGADGKDWSDMFEEEYDCLVGSLEAAGSGNPIVGNYTMFENCI